jgi:hypothetical protein
MDLDTSGRPSAPGTAFMHNGNGLNMVYVDPENTLSQSYAGSTTMPWTGFSSG